MLRFHIPNMACGGCAKSVTKALQSIDLKARIDIDQGAREVRVDTQADEQAVLTALLQAGYPAESRPEAAG